MRKARKNTATRQVIHIVGEGLTELFYFSHLKKILGYRQKDKLQETLLYLMLGIL